MTHETHVPQLRGCGIAYFNRPRAAWPQTGTRYAARLHRSNFPIGSRWPHRRLVAEAVCFAHGCVICLLSSRSSASMSIGVTKSPSLSRIRCKRPMCPIERNVVPPILRTRSAMASVMAKIWSPCSSGEGDNRESADRTRANENSWSSDTSRTHRQARCSRHPNISDRIRRQICGCLERDGLPRLGFSNTH